MIKLKKLHGSFYYAAEGWKFALKKDQNLRIHLLVAFCVLVLAFLLKLPRLEVVILFGMIILVISAELMNTAVEKIVDLIRFNHSTQKPNNKSAILPQTQTP